MIKGTEPLFCSTNIDDIWSTFYAVVTYNYTIRLRFDGSSTPFDCLSKVINATVM